MKKKLKIIVIVKEHTEVNKTKNMKCINYD